MRQDRRDRLDDMIRLFRTSERGWTSCELARRYHVSIRQVQYDLAVIIDEPDYAPLVVRCKTRREYAHISVLEADTTGR